MHSIRLFTKMKVHLKLFTMSIRSLEFERLNQQKFICQDSMGTEHPHMFLQGLRMCPLYLGHFSGWQAMSNLERQSNTTFQRQWQITSIHKYHFPVRYLLPVKQPIHYMCTKSFTGPLCHFCGARGYGKLVQTHTNSCLLLLPWVIKPLSLTWGT